MSELAPPQPEKHFEDLAELARDEHEHPRLPTPEQATPDEHEISVEAARTAVEHVAEAAPEEDPLARLARSESTDAQAPASFVNHELKAAALRRELRQIRRSLPAPSRALSRIVHQPVVRAASEAAGQTVTRPSGLLGGGLLAFAGSASYLYLAHHIGFTYNYFVFIGLLVAGFVLGLILELLLRLVRRRPKTS